MSNDTISDYPMFSALSILLLTSGSILKYEEERFSSIGLTPQQFGVLLAIKSVYGPATPRDVANWLDRNPASITFIIDRMTKIGLVERIRDIKDRRSLRLEVTPKGMELYEKAIQPAIDLSKEVMGDLSPRELSKLVTLLGKIRSKTNEFRKIKDKGASLKI
jgi:DNA-binding MarR family transcriptional regulator